MIVHLPKLSIRFFCVLHQRANQPAMVATKGFMSLIVCVLILGLVLEQVQAEGLSTDGPTIGASWGGRLGSPTAEQNTQVLSSVIGRLPSKPQFLSPPLGNSSCKDWNCYAFCVAFELQPVWERCTLESEASELVCKNPTGRRCYNSCVAWWMGVAMEACDDKCCDDCCDGRQDAGIASVNVAA
jgi:hypothetical protein